MGKWISFGGLTLAVAGVIGYYGLVMAQVMTATTPAANTLTIHYKIVGSELGAVGPNGKQHDTFSALDSTTVKVGTKITIVISNYDNAMHGMAFPDLQVAKMINPAQNGQPSQTVFTIVADHTGKLRWYCPVPCDGDNQLWAMTADRAGAGLSQDGFMAGYINVV